MRRYVRFCAAVVLSVIVCAACGVSMSTTTPTPVPGSAISPANAGRVRLLASWGSGSTGQVCFSPDGRLLAMASSVGIYLYDAGTLAQVRLIETTAPVASVAFSPGGGTVISALGDGTVRLWQVTDGALVRTLAGHNGAVTGVACAPDGATIASGSEDKTVRLWRASDGTLLRTLEGHHNEVSHVVSSPDGTTIASASWENGIRLWRVSDGMLLHMTETHTFWVESVAFSPDGTLVAGASWDHAVWLWRVRDGDLVLKLEGHTEPVAGVAFSPDGKMLASASWDQTVRLWNVEDGTPLRTLEGHAGRVNSVAFSPDGKTLASASGDQTVRLWRADDGALLSTLEGQAREVNDVAFSPDGAIIAAGATDNAVRLWGDADNLAQVLAPQPTLLLPAGDTPTPFTTAPRFVHHERPGLALDIRAFTDAGCIFDQYRALKCWDSGPLKDLGANWLFQVPDLLGGLQPAYPMAEWSFSGRQPSVYCGDLWCVGYVVYLQDHFVIVNTKEDLQAIFAPVESSDEALSYALALTGLEAVYGQEPYRYPGGCGLRITEMEYGADVVEDTHVDQVSDGYVVSLFDDQYPLDRMCCELTAVSVHVSRQGEIREESRQRVLTAYGELVLK